LLLILVSAIGWLSACDRYSTSRGHEVSDSAGVQIVVSHAPDTESLLPSIGSAAVSIGEAGLELNRVVGAVRLSDGRLVVADGGNLVLHIVSPRGTLLRTVGREGDGPGEFRTLQAVGKVAGDTVWAYDFSHHRVTFVSPNGTIVREISLRPPLAASLAVGVLPSGSIVLGESWSSARVAEASRPGLNREQVAYVRYSGDGVLLDTIGLFPGREVVLSFEGGRGVMRAAPFAHSAVHALSGSWLAIGDQVSHEIRLYSEGGDLTRIVRWDGGDLALDPELIARWRTARLRAVQSADRALVERELAEQTMPTQRPAFGRVLPTEGGGFWVADYAPGNDEPSMWAILDSEGVWQGSLVMPHRFRPLEVGLEWVLGVSRDDFDLERVELRRLVRGDEP